MKATLTPLVMQDHERASATETTRLACSIGRELAERWPFAIARVGIAVSGALANQNRSATGEAFILGLSGLPDRRSEARIVDGILALNTRMMAIRLNGRTLVAFTPDRDIRFGSEGEWVPLSRVQAGAWSASGRLLGHVERVLVSTEPGYCRVPSAQRRQPAPDAYPQFMR